MPENNDTQNGRVAPSINRSEVMLLYDAQDANPNGNPQSPGNSPRIDQHTQQAIVTDVRLKRYIRDQLHDDGHGVYIANITTDEDKSPTREYLIKAVTNVSSPEDIDSDFLEDFLDAAADVRYFGATLPFSTNDEGIAGKIAEALPQHLTGPVQFSPGRTLHAVRTNSNYDSLTSVIATDDGDGGKDGGGYDLDDNRIVYGLIGFSGVVNEYNAADTALTQEDIKRLDTLCWRAIKNQANSRSKTGQHPRLYLRAEYETDRHQGNLDRTLTLGQNSKPEEQLTDVTDASVDITGLVNRLKAVEEDLKAIYLKHDEALELETAQGELTETLEGHLEAVLNGVEINEIDVYDQYGETLPESN